MWQEKFLQYLAQTTDSPMMLEIESARGNYLYGPGGRRYLDLISGISVSVIGHNVPQVKEAVYRQLNRHTHVMVYGEFVQPVQISLAERLLQWAGPPFERVYFVNSGSEAVEGAIKVARRFTGRPWVVTFEGAYHGSTAGALALVGKSWLSRAYRPLPPGVRRLPFNDIDALDAIDHHTAAVIVEPVQGEAGAQPARRAFLRALRKRCDTTGSLLIFDEVQTGIGRIGARFALHAYNITPDILVVGKALGGGFPLGAFLGPAHVMDVIRKDPILGHITTFGGHPISCAAAEATLQIIEQKQLIKEVPAKEQLFFHHLPQLKGKGLLLALPTEGQPQTHNLIQRLLQRGIITDWFLFQPAAIRISPPLTITPQQIEWACRQINEALSEITS